MIACHEKFDHEAELVNCITVDQTLLAPYPAADKGYDVQVEVTVLTVGGLPKKHPVPGLVHCASGGLLVMVPPGLAVVT